MFRSTAHLYDLIYEAAGKDYAAEAAEVDALVTARNPGASSLLDVACETGAHLARLLDAYEIAGVDLDPRMLAEARQRLPQDVPLVEADMRTFSLGRRFDAVICLFSSIGYMPSTDDLQAAIRNMADHLHPDGLVILDGWVRPDAWRPSGSVHIDVAEGAGLSVVRVTRSERSGQTTHLEMHHLVASPDSVEHLVDHHDLTLFEPVEYEEALTAAGLVFEVGPGPIPDRDRYIARNASVDSTP
jgi:SAM-dependent methyltransferase